MECGWINSDKILDCILRKHSLVRSTVDDSLHLSQIIGWHMLGQRRLDTFQQLLVRHYVCTKNRSGNITHENEIFFSVVILSTVECELSVERIFLLFLIQSIIKVSKNKLTFAYRKTHSWERRERTYKCVHHLTHDWHWIACILHLDNQTQTE